MGSTMWWFRGGSSPGRRGDDVVARAFFFDSMQGSTAVYARRRAHAPKPSAHGHGFG